MTIFTMIRAPGDEAKVRLIGEPTGSLAEILDELFDNACRASAHAIHVECVVDQGRPTLSVYHRGPGIENPMTVLTLVNRRWDDATTRFDDPAGFSLANLAGRHVMIRSGLDETDIGWNVTISPDAWRGAAPFTIALEGGLYGTNVLVEIPEEWRYGLAQAVAAAAANLSVSVFFHARRMNPA
mgnify:CR=1 FL=1